MSNCIVKTCINIDWEGTLLSWLSNVLLAEDILRAIILSFITGIIGFNTIKHLVTTLYASLKNRLFNGYWILMITNHKNVNQISLVKLEEKSRGKIQSKKVSKRVLNGFSDNNSYKIDGQRVNSSLLLNIYLKDTFSEGCAHLLSTSINKYWSGLHLLNVAEAGVGNSQIDGSCEISLTKVRKPEKAIDFFNCSNRTWAISKKQHSMD